MLAVMRRAGSGRARRRVVGLSLLSEHGADVGRGQHDGEGEHEDRHRRGHAELAAADAEPVDVGAEQVGVAGAAARLLQDVDLREDAQVPDDLQQAHDEQHRADGGQHDVAEARDRTGAVDLGGLDQLLGQLRERGVDRERDERHAHPHDDHRRDEEEGQRPQEPPVALEVEAEPGEDVVHDAVLRVEEPLPHRERGDDRHRPREQEPGLHEESYAARHVPHQQREADADRHRERRVDEAEGDGAEGDPPQVAVGDERAVVVGADPLRRSAELLGEAVVLQGEHDLAHERVAQRHRQCQHGGDQERVRQQGGAAATGGRAGRGLLGGVTGRVAERAAHRSSSPVPV